MSRKKAYVIGTNVSNSLSPAIFQYWFEKHNVETAATIQLFLTPMGSSVLFDVDKVANKRKKGGGAGKKQLGVSASGRG